MKDKCNISSNNITGQKTILIADDQHIIRDLTETIFSELGYIVITACDGQDAVNKFKEHKDSIDIILMDVIMPRKDGFIAYKEISSLKPNVKIVYMSGYNAIYLDDKIHNFNLITKPFSCTIIVNRINDTLNGVYDYYCN